jgi:hypothetical protein
MLSKTKRPSGTAPHWIDGEWVDSPKHSESINPATGEVSVFGSRIPPRIDYGLIDPTSRRKSDGRAIA